MSDSGNSEESNGAEAAIETLCRRCPRHVSDGRTKAVCIRIQNMRMHKANVLQTCTRQIIPSACPQRTPSFVPVTVFRLREFLTFSRFTVLFKMRIVAFKIMFIAANEMGQKVFKNLALPSVGRAANKLLREPGASKTVERANWRKVSKLRSPQTVWGRLSVDELGPSKTVKGLKPVRPSALQWPTGLRFATFHREALRGPRLPSKPPMRSQNRSWRSWAYSNVWFSLYMARVWDDRSSP